MLENHLGDISDFVHSEKGAPIQFHDGLPRVDGRYEMTLCNFFAQVTLNVYRWNSYVIWSLGNNHDVKEGLKGVTPP